jgi:hypothetical protein
VVHGPGTGGLWRFIFQDHSNNELGHWRHMDVGVLELAESAVR